MSILTMPFPSSLRAATTSPLRSLAAVTVPTAPILNRKSQHQRDWHQMAGSDKRLLLTAALFRTDIENEVEQNDDGTYSQYGKKRVEGYEISVAGNITPAWQVIGGYTQQKATIKNGKDVAQMVPHRCRIPRSTPSPYGANIRQPTISLLARAHAISAVCIKVQTARWERQRLPKVTGSPMPNWGIELIAISTSS